MTKNDGGLIKSCAWCRSPSYMKQGHSRYCIKHYRFQQMRGKAKQRGLAVPSYEELEILTRNLICVGCNRTMVWLSKEDRCRVLSLQHDRSGVIRIICRSCNSRHDDFENDSFYEHDRNKKTCRKCGETKTWNNFHNNHNDQRWNSKTSQCKQCRYLNYKRWKLNNLEKFNEKRRAYYWSRKESGNPIPR